MNEIIADPTVSDAYVVTNNHYKGKAVANAAMLKSMVTGRKVPVPSGVFGAYQDAVEGYTEPADDPIPAAQAR